MTRSLLTLVLCLVSPATAMATKPVPNRPYVMSMAEGAFYARCIPERDEGIAGTTTIYQVGKEADAVVDIYHWYCKESVVLGWSPIAGKVAVMADNRGRDDGRGNRAAVSFYLGGKHIRSYTPAEMIALGADPASATLGLKGFRPVPGYRHGECRQVPGTNDYVFTVILDGGKTLEFDILMGDVKSPR